MHTVELFEVAVAATRQLGYRIRQDSFGEFGGGSCEIAGQKWIFLDLELSPIDQLGLVLDVLRDDPNVSKLDLPSELSQRLGLRQAA